VLTLFTVIILDIKYGPLDYCGAPSRFQVLSIGMFENKICHNITEYKYFLILRGRVAIFAAARRSHRGFVCTSAASMSRR
jgi:hypothetical protein